MVREEEIELSLPFIDCMFKSANWKTPQKSGEEVS